MWQTTRCIDDLSQSLTFLDLHSVNIDQVAPEQVPVLQPVFGFEHEGIDCFHSLDPETVIRLLRFPSQGITEILQEISHHTFEYRQLLPRQFILPTADRVEFYIA